MKGADVKPGIYIEFEVDHDRDLNFKTLKLVISVRILKYNFFFFLQSATLENWSDED